MPIEQLALNAGLAGVAIYTIYTLKKLVGNHINHNTRALQKLCDCVDKLASLIDKKL